ncbi:MAG: DUF488 family protein, N3 subclade [Vulcanimicrobiaceae bacterium]
MELATIGFTQKSAQSFFGLLARFGTRELIDIRLRRHSQLSGFAKYPDVAYFAKKLCRTEYYHEPLLAPTPQLLQDYRKKRISWGEYERSYLALLANRQVQEHLNIWRFADRAVLLCSEPTSDHCHRRLAIEYLRRFWGEITEIRL